MNIKNIRSCKLLKSTLLVLGLLTCSVVVINQVHAEVTTININLQTSVPSSDSGEGKQYKSISKDIYDLIEFEENISEIKESSILTLTTDNEQVAEIGYEEQIIKKGKDDKTNIKWTDSIVFTGKQLKYIALDNDEKRNMKSGTWTTDIFLIAHHKGTANITMTIDNSGVITTQSYHVTVKGTTPKLGKKLANSKVIVNNEYALLVVKQITNDAKVSMKCNKDDGVQVYGTDEEVDKIYCKKKLEKAEKTVKVADKYAFVAKKAGNLKITIKIEQDGKTYTFNYKMHAEKYKNPFKSFVISGKDYAKYFNDKQKISDKVGYKTSLENELYTKQISKKDCKRTLGGKSFKIKMKKGYKLQKITYRNYGEWAEKHTLGSSATKLPKKFWELHITYKDSKGRKWTNYFVYSNQLFY